MHVAVVIPWRPQPERLRVFECVKAHLIEHFPEWSIIACDVDTEAFCLAGARNLGVRLADWADVVVINDADTFAQPESLLAAVEHVHRSGGMALPYTTYRVLQAKGTQQFLEGKPLEACHSLTIVGATSGVFVTTPEAWWANGGQDERFLGWGFEDAAWRTAADVLGGLTIMPGTVWAADHPSQIKEGPQYTASAGLVYRYLQAGSAMDSGEAMRLLLSEPGRFHASTR